MGGYSVYNSFNSGELSPKLISRTDVSQYGHGCRRLENFLVTPYGNVERRPGTLHVASLDGQSSHMRLVPFVVSSTITYLVVFSDHSLAVYDGDSSSPIWEHSAVWSGDEISTIQYVQSADVLTIVHGNHPVYELRRTASDEFSLDLKEFEFYPMLDENTDDSIKIFPLSAAYLPTNATSAFVKNDSATNANRKGNRIMLAATDNIFDPGMIGSVFQLKHYRRDKATCELTGDWRILNSASAGEWDLVKTNDVWSGVSKTTLEVYGAWSFITHGTWTGTVRLQRAISANATGTDILDSDWMDIGIWNSEKDSNVSTSGEETEINAYYRVTIDGYEQSTTGTIKKCVVALINSNVERVGIVQIEHTGSTAVALTNTVLNGEDDTQGCFAYARLLTKVSWMASFAGSTSTTNSTWAKRLARFPNQLLATDLTVSGQTIDWAEGAWSNYRGYPRTVAFFEERMMFGGTKYKPMTVWGSKTGDWDNFLIGDKDNDGLEFSLYSNTLNTIVWMCQHDALAIGTLDAEWTLSGNSSAEALTPSSLRIRRQSVYGSAGIPATMVGDVILFVQRGSRKIREFCYSWEKDGYSAPDMTMLAEHITQSGIVETALMHLPDSILWCLKGDGTLAALTYERDQEVVGWHRHNTAGIIESIAVIPHGDSDRLYMIVRRDGTRHLEMMAPRADGLANACYLDCSSSISHADSNSAVVPSYMAGWTVEAITDGAYEGCITIPDDCVVTGLVPGTTTFGLAYSSILEPMPIELNMGSGPSLYRKKVIGEIRIRVADSVGGQVKAGNGLWQDIHSWDLQNDRLDCPVTGKSEIIRINPRGGYEEETSLIVRQMLPYPLNVIGIGVIFDVGER